MSGTQQPFSKSYAEARGKFLQAAGAAGLSIESRPHPLPGRDGELLAMDIAREGAPDAQSVLFVSSGCHGVEGYCGSGVQVAMLGDDAWRARATERGVAVVHIHALNPYGFSHIRRTTHENIDLNRNFHDFTRPLPRNVDYRELHPLLFPAEWPPAAQNGAALQEFISRRGERAYQAAVSGGQYEFPDGLFFGGTGPSWSNLALREVLRSHGQAARRIAWIDLHTGLGPSGVGERIFSARDDAGTLARARAWWDGDGRTPVTSIYDGSSTSAFLTGMMFNAFHEECPQAEYTGLALEYGTLPLMQTFSALRAEQWLHLHPETPPELAARIKQDLFEAFYTDTDAWRGQVLAQAREAMTQAVDGLAA